MGVTNKLIKMIVNCRNKVKFKLRIPSPSYNSVQNGVFYRLTSQRRRRRRKQSITFYDPILSIVSYIINNKNYFYFEKQIRKV